MLGDTNAPPLSPSIWKHPLRRVERSSSRRNDSGCDLETWKTWHGWPTIICNGFRTQRKSVTLCSPVPPWRPAWHHVGILDIAPRLGSLIRESGASHCLAPSRDGKPTDTFSAVQVACLVCSATPTAFSSQCHRCHRARFVHGSSSLESSMHACAPNRRKGSKSRASFIWQEMGEGVSRWVGM